ncbi:hypothetical protein BJV74DRAFT_776148 [Russula compacta]|nr:hypothetical protein BJV74DRAFT_776148 [Russula compacta]
MSEVPPTNYDSPSPGYRTRTSLITSASGVADSTISFNTYATGITEGSLCLSQFPPPPMTIPSTASPTTERFFPSPVRSTFTVTPRAGPSVDQGQPSPARSTFTVTAPAQVSPSRGPASPIARPGLVLQQALPSPAQSTFTITSPTSVGTPPRHHSPSHGPGKTERLQNSDSRARPLSPTSLVRAGKLSPYDWHEGSSILSVDPAEERMLSTSFITELLSSTASFTSSPSDSSPRAFRPSYQADVGSLVSELSYPPSLRHHDPIARSSRFRLGSVVPGEGPDSHTNGENDTIASYSYEGSADIIQPGHGLTRKVSVLGMAPATLRQVASAASIPESLHPQSQVTCSSTAPLNPHPPSVFSSIMDKIQPIDIQPPISAPLHFTPETDFVSGKPSVQVQRRTSAHSSRTVKTHVSSLISAAGQRTARAARATMEWMRIKPLPPVPTIPNISLFQEQEHRRMDGAVPLPQLAERADRLTAMLDSGRLPHDSIRSPSRLGSDKGSPPGVGASGVKVPSGGRRRQSANFDGMQSNRPQSPPKSKSFLKRPISQRSKIKLFIGTSLLALLTLIGIVVGVTVGHKHAHSSTCPANRTGNTCNLDSTCVCTSAKNTSQCEPLAQGLVSLIPIVNDRFNANFTPAFVVNAMSSSGASGLSNDCAAQARVVDVSPALDSQSVPNRTEWAQGALLWSFVLSQNTSSVGKLRDFISNADWSSLPGDSPVTGLSKFSTTELGYTFDFAAQTVSEPSVSFITDGQPSNTQLAEVSSTARTALDRMYTFASASSTLQATALTNYWQNVLQQDPSKFPTFVSLLISSPILMPFNANGTAGNTSISSLLTNSTTAPFPPPLSCYPGLTQSQSQLVSNLETSVFGLSSPTTTQAQFNDSCFADRPIYGVLNILRLRLPFQDSQTGSAKQAAILSPDASSRVVIYNGEVLSGLPNSNTSSIPTTDPRQFGTLHHISHVLLDFFQAIPDIKVATQFVDYVLSYPVTPPSNDTLLGQSLDAIPTLEVAVFGSVTPPDVIGVVSSFTTPSGGLFFGTDQSLAMRDWAMVATRTSVTWTEFANSSMVVDDNSLTDEAFNAVWNPAYLYFHSSSNATVNVGNITAGFIAVNKFTSS